MYMHVLIYNNKLSLRGILYTCMMIFISPIGVLYLWPGVVYCILSGIPRYTSGTVVYSTVGLPSTASASTVSGHSAGSCQLAQVHANARTRHDKTRAVLFWRGS